MSQEKTDTPRLPPYYKAPAAITPERHARAGLSRERSFAFAHKHNAVLLTLPEMVTAARQYPIAFSAQSPAIPLAVLGLRDGENLFVDGQGQWRADYYVPAYVRRYPFIFVEEPGSQRLILCVDEGAEEFEPESERPFFAEGKPSALLQDVMRFSESYQAQYEETLRFGAWLEAEGLLAERQLRAELKDGKVFTLSGFRTLDVDKFRALPDDKILEAHRRGWLPLVHFHQQSLANWATLGALVAVPAAAA
jgi:hypothetical protein